MHAIDFGPYFGVFVLNVVLEIFEITCNQNLNSPFKTLGFKGPCRRASRVLFS